MDKMAYLQASKDKQGLSHQKLEILVHAQKNKINISNFIKIQISSRKASKQRHIEQLADMLKVLGYINPITLNTYNKRRSINIPVVFQFATLLLEGCRHRSCTTCTLPLPHRLAPRCKLTYLGIYILMLLEYRSAVPQPPPCPSID